MNVITIFYVYSKFEWLVSSLATEFPDALTGRPLLLNRDSSWIVRMPCGGDTHCSWFGCPSLHRWDRCHQPEGWSPTQIRRSLWVAPVFHESHPLEHEVSPSWVDQLLGRKLLVHSCFHGPSWVHPGCQHSSTILQSSSNWSRDAQCVQLFHCMHRYINQFLRPRWMHP